MKRYECVTETDYNWLDGTAYSYASMTADPRGEWVSFEDADALRAIVESLPRCVSPGCGYATHASYDRRDGAFYYCDAHYPPWAKPLPYAMALRAYEARK